jgi:hypothetical protein
MSQMSEKQARRRKIGEIETALRIGDVAALRSLAADEYGLIEDRLRRECWPLLLDIKLDELPPLGDRKTLRNSKHASQVKLDVDRSIKRFPEKMPEKQRIVLQEQLMDLILWVLVQDEALHYYQGYHDICVTVLQVCGARLGQVIAKELSNRHLRDYMCKTMDQTTMLLDFIMPILKEEDSELYGFLLESEVGTIFALSWLITWYGHVINEHKYVVRLFDFFVAAHPLMPLYIAAAMVLHCGDDVLDQECDMPTVHHHLTNIPQTLDLAENLQKIIESANILFMKHPPSYLAGKNEAYMKRCSILSEFRHMEPESRLQAPKIRISDAYKKIATISVVGLGIFVVTQFLYMWP